jgi:hypothetical protein
VPASSTATAPVDLHFEYRDSAGIHVVKDFHLEPASYIFTFRSVVTENDKAIPASVVWGPAISDITELSRGVKKSEGILFQGGKVVRLALKDIAKQSAYDGQFQYAGVDDNYFMVAALPADPIKVSFSPVTIPPPDGSRIRPAIWSRSRSNRRHRHADQILRRAQGLRRPERARSRPCARDRFRHVHRDRGAVAPVAQVGEQLRRQLRLGDHPADVLHQRDPVPAPHKSVVSMRKMQEIQPEVKAISGSLLEAEGHRSRPSRR